ncbi:MAG: RNA polymerase sigma factor, partial [Dongiaceae bacterium]
MDAAGDNPAQPGPESVSLQSPPPLRALPFPVRKQLNFRVVAAAIGAFVGTGGAHRAQRIFRLRPAVSRRQSAMILVPCNATGKAGGASGTISRWATWFFEPATAAPSPRHSKDNGSTVGMLNEELSRLIEHEIPRLRRYAMFLARDPERADDLVQECLVRAIDNIDKFQPGTKIRSWMMTILHNIFVNEMKKRRPVLTHDGMIERSTPVEGGQEARHQMRDVQRAFEVLTWQHRQIIWFICVEQMDYNEVARQLGVPVGTVRSRLCRAREHLKRLVE